MMINMKFYRYQIWIRYMCYGILYRLWVYESLIVVKGSFGLFDQHW